MEIGKLEILIKIISMVIASVGGLIAAFKAIHEMKQNRAQRALEYRWKQTEQAKGFLASIKGEYTSSSALTMLDYSGKSYYISKDEKSTVTFEELEHAMRIVNLQFSNKEVFIRDCFDDLYEKLALIEHFIRLDFINFADIAGPLKYYIGIILKDRYHKTFMKEYNYELAVAFVDRFIHNQTTEVPSAIVP